ncbi:MAG: sugar phosphate isomerase/epimerase [Planctomycetota bacterium]|nr:sugar phosphate isomerase/epimerase [Planctomycetota bacterium]
MKLGFVSAILPDLALEEVIGFAARERFECVELMCWPKGKAERRYAGVTHVDVAALDKDAARRVADLLGAAGIAISGLGYYPNPLSPDEAEARVYVEHIKKVIRAAATLGVNQMNTFVGRDWTKTVDDNWPRFLKVWRPLVKFAEDRMFEAIPSPSFGLNFDPSHLVWQQIDYVKPLREFAARLFHVHAKDVRIDKDRLDEVGILATPLLYHCPKLPGLGEVDWGRFLSVLGDVGYRGPVCIEVEDRAYEATLETRKAALRQSATFLRQFMPAR